MGGGRMRDDVLEGQVVTLPLRFGMMAHRAEQAISKVANGLGLADEDREALHRGVEFLEKAKQGSEVLRTKRMANYTFEAMSAYDVAKQATRTRSKPDGAKAEEVLQTLAKISQVLRD